MTLIRRDISVDRHMMPDYFVNDKTKKFFAKYRIYTSIFCQLTHSFNLLSFSFFVFSR